MNVRFDKARHEYSDEDTGEILEHTTSLLKKAGEVDDTWLTDEGRRRGTAVHDLTRDYDLGVIERPETLRADKLQGDYKPYLLAHVRAMEMIQHEWTAIEVAFAHPFYRYGCRPDRGGTIYGAHGVLEIKTGAKEKHHAIQTALQAMVLAAKWKIPERALVRYALYLKPSGKFTLDPHPRLEDYDRAHEIARKFCRPLRGAA